MDLSVDFAGITFANPLIASAGTAGYGYDLDSIATNNAFSGIVTKTTTPKPWVGAKFPRVCETEHGMLNAIGLQNDGLDGLIKTHLPQLKEYQRKIFVSIAANTTKDFVIMTEKLSSVSHVDGIELNVSCPNSNYGGQSFASNNKLLLEVVRGCVKKKGKKPLIVKLSPHVNSIAETCKVVEGSGADAVAICNTLRGLKIDVNSGRAMLANIVGGYSGIAVKPIILAMVYEAHKAIKIPIIGIGGVNSGNDVAEYIMAGATLVGVGTANLVNANVSKKILTQFEKLLKKKNTSLTSLIGKFLPPMDADE